MRFRIAISFQYKKEAEDRKGHSGGRQAELALFRWGLVFDVGNMLPGTPLNNQSRLQGACRKKKRKEATCRKKAPYSLVQGALQRRLLVAF